MKVYAKGYWGFSPEIWPFVTFKHRSSRAMVLENWQEGDRIVNFQTKTEGDALTRGCLHGVVEFGTSFVDAKIMINASPHLELKALKYFDKRGNYKWPYALPMQRAWRFSSLTPIKVTDVFGSDFYKRLTTRQRRGLDPYLLPQDLVDKLQSLTAMEVPVSQEYGGIFARGTTGSTLSDQGGPRPTGGAIQFDRNLSGKAYTYLLQYGDNPIWKVGCTRFLEKRVEAINRQIPSELCNVAKWKLVTHREWSHINYAYDMEQAAIQCLRDMGLAVRLERTACDWTQIDRAWKLAFMKLHGMGAR